MMHITQYGGDVERFACGAKAKLTLWIPTWLLKDAKWWRWEGAAICIGCARHARPRRAKRLWLVKS